VLDAGPFVVAGWFVAERLGHQVGDGAASDPAALAALVDRERIVALSIAAVVALALAVYATLSHALAGATLGKRLLGIRVVGPDGRRPSPGRSAVRSGVAAISLALLGLGFLVALFSRTGRALHDVASGTWVVKAP
jgi:uncharacterized RDD family membrane protein YckC